MMNSKSINSASSLQKLILNKINFVPGSLALLIQCIALIIIFAFVRVFCLAGIFFFSMDISISLFELVLMQSFLSALLSHWFRMENWWRWIHLLFPLSLWFMSSWHLPNGFYLSGFIIFLSLFWTTFHTQVPFYPSSAIVWRNVAKHIPQDKSVRMIDIGSGLGDMTLCVAKLRPESQIEGIEIAPLPWLISYLRSKLSRSKTVFKLGDYNLLDFGKYDIVFAYLSPAAMQALWKKAHLEMLPGSYLMSLEFDIPGVTPSFCIEGTSSPTIYVWEMP